MQPLARLRCFAAEQQEVTWCGGLFEVKGVRRGGSRKPSLHWCLCPSISLVPEECANIIGDACAGHVIPFGRMQRAHLRARRVNPRCPRRCPREYHPHSWQAAP